MPYNKEKGKDAHQLENGTAVTLDKRQEIPKMGVILLVR